MANSNTPKASPEKVEEVREAAEKVADPTKNVSEPTPPGVADANHPDKVNVKATGPFLVFDVTTSDYVGEGGGEMRRTSFVDEQLENGKLVEV